MRILLINYEYPPVGGGGGNTTRHLAEGFVRLGHTPFVLTTAWSNLPLTETVNGVAIHRLPAGRRLQGKSSIAEMLRFMFVASRAAPKLAEEWRIDVAVAFFTLPSGPVAAKLKLPYFIALLGGDVPGFDPASLGFYHWLTGGWITRLWGGAEGVVANAQGLARLARAHAPGQKIDVIAAGSDDKVPFKTDYRSSVEIHLLFVGRLVRQKGLDVLIAALAKVDARWRLSVVGDGPEKMSVDGVTYLGWKNPSELAQLYQTADIFISPSRSEGMSNAMLDAMAAGLPVIATRISGTDEVVGDQTTGLLVPPENADALAAAIKTLISDPAARERMGRAGRARAQGEFSWHAAAAKWSVLIERARK